MKIYPSSTRIFEQYQKKKVIQAIHDNDFSEKVREQFSNPKSLNLLNFTPITVMLLLKKAVIYTSSNRNTIRTQQSL
jgi:hypothetical protein